MKQDAQRVSGLWRADVRVLVVSLGAIGAAVALEGSGSNAYAMALGEASPVAATVAACLLGLLSLRILEACGWFRSAGGTRRGYLVALLLGAVLPIPVLIVDILGGFSQGINVSAPDAFLFYPAIAVVAEFVLHVAPLALVALGATLVSKADERARKLAMALAVLPEPILQMVWGAAYSPAWANAYVGIQLLVFGLLGLALFRRHGFLAVYLYRLAYYAVWHIVWGYMRLGILFGR